MVAHELVHRGALVETGRVGEHDLVQAVGVRVKRAMQYRLGLGSQSEVEGAWCVIGRQGARAEGMGGKQGGLTWCLSSGSGQKTSTPTKLQSEGK